ncbi:MAG: mechanosensitive ion channel family protein [Rhodobacteraceae bacterium]|nr:MAG: mechanosensitive ion channel family protein [Paracoccaceae bacterium]
MVETGVVIQLPVDASPELIERLAEAFPDATIAPAEPEPLPMVFETAALDQALTDAVYAAPALPARLAAWWETLPFGGWGAIALVVGALLAGWLVERGVALLITDRAAGCGSAPFAARFGRALRWFTRRLLLIGVFAAAAVVVFRAVAPAEAALAAYARAMLTVVAFNRVLYVVLTAITAPGDSGRRLLAIDDEAARRLATAALWTITGLSAVGVLRGTLDVAAGVGPATVLARLALIAVSGLIGVGFFLRCAAPVRALLVRQLGPDPDSAAGWKRLLAERWSLGYIGLVLLDAGLKATGVLGLLGDGAMRGAGHAVAILVLVPLAVAGLRVWRAEATAATGEEDPVRGGAVCGFAALAEGAIIVAAATLILRAWGIDPFAPTAESALALVASRLVVAAVVLVAGFALWRAAAALMAARGDAAAPDISDEERQSRQRLGTILPVIRGFVLAVIGVVTVMTALSYLGLNIGPLIASAGVVGLAIGFGAQRLVADVISGLLYLYEDAFRIGEYIEVQGGKGRVERISIRSVRLRHPRGPVYTIPFSSMGTVQNHARDFATMKFSFQVPAGTDLEKVRKLVKKAGEKMMEDPEVAPHIIEPLKSQGAVAISGPAYTIGIKFTAKPGEQFAVRRRAFIAVSQALQENGIALYTPKLTLDPNNPAELKPMAPDGSIAAQ